MQVNRGKGLNAWTELTHTAYDRSVSSPSYGVADVNRAIAPGLFPGHYGRADGMFQKLCHGFQIQNGFAGCASQIIVLRRLGAIN